MRASSFNSWSEPPLSPEEIEAQDPVVRWRKRHAQAEPPSPEAKPETVRHTHDDGNGLITAEIGQKDAPAPAAEGDWSAWERWVRGTLDNERAVMIPWFEKMLENFANELLDPIEPQLKKIGALELKLAKLDGAVDVLRGKEPPPPAKFPKVEAWEPDVVYHGSDIVTFAGATWQARCDTAKTPGGADWVCLATAGRSVNICGTYDSSTDYNLLDVVACGGSSFIALKDSPGPCPGSGDWQLLVGRGSRGPTGSRGERGFAGPKGEVGEPAQRIKGWHVDHARYVIQPVMTNGEVGPELQLRELFQQFLSDVQPK